MLPANAPERYSLYSPRARLASSANRPRRPHTVLLLPLLLLQSCNRIRWGRVYRCELLLRPRSRASTRCIFHKTTCAQVDVEPAPRRYVGSTQRPAPAPCSVRSRRAPATLSGHRTLGSCRVVHRAYPVFGDRLRHAWKRDLLRRAK